MLLAHAVTVGAGTPLWAVIASTVGAASIGSGATYFQMRKILPVQKREMEATVQQLAVQTAESALKTAKERTDMLEQRVAELTARIDELRDNLAHATEGQERMDAQLTLTLVERAKLQAQISELALRLGKDHIDLAVPPPDAIVMVDLDSGEINYANEGTYSLLGYIPSDLKGHPLEMLVPEAKRSVHTTDRVKFAQDPQPRQMGTGIPLTALTAYGTEIPVDISLHPTGDGRVLALLKRRAPAPGA